MSFEVNLLKIKIIAMKFPISCETIHQTPETSEPITIIITYGRIRSVNHFNATTVNSQALIYLYDP